MIYFVSTRRNNEPITHYLASHGAPLASLIIPTYYSDLGKAANLPRGTYIFTDLELLTPSTRQLVTKLWDRLTKTGSRVLNHPTRSLRRYDLLRLLHERGINRFSVHRLAEMKAPPRFPVFLRGEHDHGGSQTPLLRGPRQLSAAIGRLGKTNANMADVLVTEFCDTADDQGIYRKYAAFVVGNTVLARHLQVSNIWNVKDARLLDPPFLLEEKQYLETNPHADRLREIFALAHIEYGRIDYSLAGDAIQVWEINTNPIIAGAGGQGRPERQQIHIHFAANLQKVWLGLDQAIPAA